MCADFEGRYGRNLQLPRSAHAVMRDGMTGKLQDFCRVVLSGFTEHPPVSRSFWEESGKRDAASPIRFLIHWIPPMFPESRGQNLVPIVLHRVSSSHLVSVDPSSRALSGRLKFTVRRHKFNKYSFSYMCRVGRTFWEESGKRHAASPMGTGTFTP